MAYDSSTDDKLMTKGVFKKFVDTYYNKAQIGLGNVDNTSDADKPVSTAQASAIKQAQSSAVQDATSYTQTNSSIPEASPSVKLTFANNRGTVEMWGQTTTTPVNITTTDLRKAVAQLASMAHKHQSVYTSSAGCTCDCNGYCPCNCNNDCSDDNHCDDKQSS